MSLPKMVYEAYNAGGDPSTANKNYRGEPCPAWEDLPENIQAKWTAATQKAGLEVMDAIVGGLQEGLGELKKEFKEELLRG